MSEEGATQHRDLSIALQALNPKYRKALLKECDEEKINRICESILDTLDKISIKDIRESKFSFLKLHCIFSSNIV